VTLRDGEGKKKIDVKEMGGEKGRKGESKIRRRDERDRAGVNGR